MLGHAATALDLLAVKLARTCGRVAVEAAHLGERPGQIDGGRPRLQQGHCRGVEVLPPLGRERIAVRRGDADGRSASHGQRPDRFGDLGGRPADQLHLLVGKAALVEDDHPVVLEPNDLFWV
jgi:hypothetical protein